MMKRSSEPVYWGGMILSSNIGEVYAYEEWLSAMMLHRLRKYQKRWQFFLGMLAIARKKSYHPEDRHVIPGDPLICFDGDAMYFSDVLALKRYKLKMLEFEVMKYYRRKGRYPL